MHVDIRDGTSLGNVKLPTRIMHNLQIACKEKKDPLVAVNAEIATHPIEHAIVNLQISSPDHITPAKRARIGYSDAILESSITCTFRQAKNEQREHSLELSNLHKHSMNISIH